MPELRQDRISGRPVVVAAERAARPHTVAPSPAAPTPADCPFCSGNESMTPPEVARTGGGAPDTPGWRVRVVPNLYPIVEAGDEAAGRATGAHEVVVLSPDHHADFGRLDDETAAEVLTMMRDRVRHHLDSGRAFAFAFVNHGRAAGASIGHPHAQVVALDVVPPRVADMAERFATEDLVARELAVARASDLVVVDGPAPGWCPPAAPSAYGMRVAHRSTRARFDEATDAEIRVVGVGLRDALARIDTLLGSPAYNVVLHTAAPGVRAGEMHWHAELVPRLSHHAGFEFGTGMLVNVVPPEQAAALLREAGS